MLVTDFLRGILLSLSFVSGTTINLLAPDVLISCVCFKVSSICAVSAAPRRLPKVYGVLLYDYFTTLDVMGPLSYFNNLPDVEVFFIHNSVNATPSGNVTSFDDVYVGQFYKSVYTLDNAPPLDVLVVPGSFTGTGPGIKQGIWAEYIKKVYPNVQYIFSVCTGSGFVAASGILDGRRATTNKGAYKFIKTLGPKVRWVPEARWVVDGNIWTSSG
jgi:putative intracellular protease/amidase